MVFVIDLKVQFKNITFNAGIVMAEEKEEVVLKSHVWLQKQEESLKDGFTITFKGEQFTFFPKYIDRSDKKMDRLLTGKVLTAVKQLKK